MESLHPMVVHFPIALLFSAVGLDLLALLLKRSGFHRIALWNLGLGVLGAAAAAWTGWQAAEIAKHTLEIHRIIELHRKLGLATLILGTLVLVWRLWRRDQFGPRSRIVMTGLLLVLAGVLSYGAHLGGRLVYEFGVGGQFGHRAEETAPHQH